MVVNAQLMTHILTCTTNSCEEAWCECKTLHAQHMAEDAQFWTGISGLVWCLSAPMLQDVISVIKLACHVPFMGMVAIDRSRNHLEEFLLCGGVDTGCGDAR